MLHVYGSNEIIFHDEFVMKQTLMHIESIGHFYSIFIHLILYYDQVWILYIYYVTDMTQQRRKTKLLLAMSAFLVFNPPPQTSFFPMLLQLFYSYEKYTFPLQHITSKKVCFFYLSFIFCTYYVLPCTFGIKLVPNPFMWICISVKKYVLKSNH